MNDHAATAEPEVRSLSQLLEDLKASLKDGTVTIGDLVEALHERGIAMLLLVLSAPMALPVPVPPGINILLATPLLLLTGQQVMGGHTIWLPEKTKRKSFSGDNCSGKTLACLAIFA